MPKISDLFINGSFAALSRAWAAVGGAIGLVVLLVTESFVAPVYGLLAGLHVALFLAHHNATKALEARNTALDAIKKARPRIHFLQARYSSKIRLRASR